MADAVFDAVIVGGGTKGMVLAMYLAKYGGMDVGVFEEQHELGGCWKVEDGAAPGFQIQTCTAGVADWYDLPLRWDFPDWEEKGGRFAYGKYASAIIFEEDQTHMGFHSRVRDPDQIKTAEEIAWFSEKDAQTYLTLWGAYKESLYPAFLEFIFNPPPPPGIPDALTRAIMDLIVNPRGLNIDRSLPVRSRLQLFLDLFESREVQSLFSHTTEGALKIPGDMPGTAGGAFVGIVHRPTLGYVPGGSHMWGHAAVKIFQENRGKTFTRKEVDKILIENGRAKGIRLVDGTEVEARKLVVTDVDPYQLCFRLIGKDYLSSLILRRVAALERDYTCVLWVHYAVHELPNYIAGEEIRSAIPLALACKDPTCPSRHAHERKLGIIPSPDHLCWTLAGLGEPHYPQDPTMSPEGKYIAGVDFSFPAATKLSEREWLEVKKTWPDHILKWWQRFAPNMTWDNVIGVEAITPYDVCRLRNLGPQGNWGVIDPTPAQLGVNRPIPELAGYRTPIKGLYATGAAWHPLPAGIVCQGYNAYKVIAGDYGLRKPWEEQGRPF